MFIIRSILFECFFLCFSCRQIEDRQCGCCGQAVNACQLASRLLGPGRDCDRLQDLLLPCQVAGSAWGLSREPDLDPWGTGRCWTCLDQWSGSVDRVQGDDPFLSPDIFLFLKTKFISFHYPNEYWYLTRYVTYRNIKNKIKVYSDAFCRLVSVQGRQDYHLLDACLRSLTQKFLRHLKMLLLPCFKPS